MLRPLWSVICECTPRRMPRTRQQRALRSTQHAALLDALAKEMPPNKPLRSNGLRPVSARGSMTAAGHGQRKPHRHQRHDVIGQDSTSSKDSPRVYVPPMEAVISTGRPRPDLRGFASVGRLGRPRGRPSRRRVSSTPRARPIAPEPRSILLMSRGWSMPSPGLTMPVAMAKGMASSPKVRAKWAARSAAWRWRPRPNRPWLARPASRKATPAVA